MSCQVNCYSGRDWMLSLVYRYQRLEATVAGIAPVKVGGQPPSCVEARAR
jgi:hypothetical protein